jgi:hypothetical protein
MFSCCRSIDLRDLVAIPAIAADFFGNIIYRRVD